jgi:hypothetical protein
VQEISRPLVALDCLFPHRWLPSVNLAPVYPVCIIRLLVFSISRLLVRSLLVSFLTSLWIVSSLPRRLLARSQRRCQAYAHQAQIVNLDLPLHEDPQALPSATADTDSCLEAIWLSRSPMIVPSSFSDAGDGCCITLHVLSSQLRSLPMPCSGPSLRPSYTLWRFDAVFHGVEMCKLSRVLLLMVLKRLGIYCTSSGRSEGRQAQISAVYSSIMDQTATSTSPPSGLLVR